MNLKPFIMTTTFSLLLIVPSWVLAQPPSGVPPGGGGPPFAGGGLQFLVVLSGGNQVSPTSLPDCDQESGRCFGDIPGMTATFNTSVTGCVVAILSFQNIHAFEFRILLDGLAMDGGNIFDNNEGTNAGTIQANQDVNQNFMVTSHTFTKCNVPSGSHAISAQNSGSKLFGHTLVALGQ